MTVSQFQKRGGMDSTAVPQCPQLVPHWAKLSTDASGTKSPSCTSPHTTYQNILVFVHTIPYSRLSNSNFYSTLYFNPPTVQVATTLQIINQRDLCDSFAINALSFYCVSEKPQQLYYTRVPHTTFRKTRVLTTQRFLVRQPAPGRQTRTRTHKSTKTSNVLLVMSHVLTKPTCYSQHLHVLTKCHMYSQKCTSTHKTYMYSQKCTSTHKMPHVLTKPTCYSQNATCTHNTHMYSQHPQKLYHVSQHSTMSPTASGGITYKVYKPAYGLQGVSPHSASLIT